MAKIRAWVIAKAMVEAGMFTAEDMNNIRRIVIDLNYDSVPVMYVESFVDEKLLDVFTTLNGIEIRGVYRDPPSADEEDDEERGEIPAKGEEGASSGEVLRRQAEGVSGDTSGADGPDPGFL